jgi:threonine/homoserine/homoserine lactone efflux protein
MIDQSLLLGLVAFAFVSSATPGPNNLMLMASGTNFGFARTIPHMLGVALGFVLMVILVGLGLAKLFEAWPILHVILKIGSVAYLVYLAWKIATASAPKGDRAASNGKPMTFVQAGLFQWVNPKAWTMALGAVSVYVPPSSPVLGLLLVAGVFGAINLPVVSAWAAMGVQLRRLLQDPVRLRIFNVTAALLLLASLYPVIFDGH